MALTVIKDVGRVLNVNYTTTALVIPTIQFVSNHNARGSAFYIYSTTAGTVNIYYRGLGDERVSLQTQAIVASTLFVMDFDFPIPRCEVEFTPASAPGSIWVDAHSYPYGV